MGNEKRNADDNWIEATLIEDEGLRGAYLASFSGVLPPGTTTFQEYKRKRIEDRSVVDVILQGETERIEFEGRTINDDSGDNCQYAIGVFNEDKGNLKLLRSPMIHMRRSIKSLKSGASKGGPETPSRTQEQRIALGTAFGSKRSKAAIQSQLNSHIDGKALESIASQIYDNVKAATENIPSQDILMEDINADRPIPTIDLSATTVSGLYSLDAVVSESELSLINVEHIYSLPDEAARLSAIPYKNSRYINDRLKLLFKQEAQDYHRLRMLFYASLLMAFFKNHRLVSKRAALISILGPVPNPLIDGLLSRYTEEQLTSTKEDAKKRTVCTSRCQDKVVCYLFVLCLMLDDFSVDINELAHDLQLKVNRAMELFRTVGCKIALLSDVERERRGITKSEAKTYKVANLKIPPEFPKVRRPKAQPGRR